MGGYRCHLPEYREGRPDVAAAPAEELRFADLGSKKNTANGIQRVPEESYMLI